MAGSEDRYIRFFLGIGSRIGVPEDLAARFADAYTGLDRLRCAFEHYRAMPANAAWNESRSALNRLRMPVTAVGAAVVGDVIARQLTLVSDDLVEHVLPEVGHIVPIDDPHTIADIVPATARRTRIASRPATCREPALVG